MSTVDKDLYRKGYEAGFQKGRRGADGAAVEGGVEAQLVEIVKELRVMSGVLRAFAQKNGL